MLQKFIINSKKRIQKKLLEFLLLVLVEYLIAIKNILRGVFNRKFILLNIFKALKYSTVVNIMENNDKTKTYNTY